LLNNSETLKVRSQYFDRNRKSIRKPQPFQQLMQSNQRQSAIVLGRCCGRGMWLKKSL